MRRRLTYAIVGVVAGALLVTGVGTLVLARRASLNDTRHTLARQAVAVASTTDEVARPAAIAVIQRALRLDNATLARYQPRTGNWLDVPAGVTSADLAPLTTRASVSGNHNRLVYAAATAQGPRGARVAVILTRQMPSSAGGVGFFLIAAAIALGIAALVGDRLGRRIARPLTEAEAATRRIAKGDLGARVTPPPAGDPELTSLAASINAMAENLSRLRGLERQFLLSVSHDLRTPLTSIRGFAEAIADGATDDTVKAAGVIAAEARRLERLVADLLDLARLDARVFKLTPRAVDVSEVVTDTAEGFRPAAHDAGLELAVDAEQGVEATTDPERLAQVVANLVENALKFAAERIDVVLAGGRELVIAVTDDGPGIPVEEQARVFDRLYQPERDPAVKPRQVGSGLGLAIVAELVTAMGGTVRAIDGPDGGTRMLVTLPAAGSTTSSTTAAT